MAEPRKNRPKIRFVYKPSSLPVKIVVLSSIVVALVALLVLGGTILKHKEKEDALRQKAAQLEQENQQLEEDISLLGSIESVMRIEQEKLGLMPPDSEIIVPQTEP